MTKNVYQPQMTDSDSPGTAAQRLLSPRFTRGAIS